MYGPLAAIARAVGVLPTIEAHEGHAVIGAERAAGTSRCGIGTALDRSKVPQRKWAFAIGISK